MCFIIVFFKNFCSIFISRSDKEADLSKPSCDFNSTIGLDDIDNSIQIINDCSPPKSTDNTPSITSPIVIVRTYFQ